MDDLVSDMQSQSEERFTQRMQRLHRAIQNINAKLKEHNIPQFQRNNLVNSVYTEVEKVYKDMLEKANDLANQKNSLVSIASTKDQEYVDEKFQNIVNDGRQFKGDVVDGLGLEPLEELVVNTINNSQRHPLERRLLNTLTYHYRRSLAGLSQSDRNICFIVGHFLKRMGGRNLRQATRELQDAITIVQKDKNNEKKILTIDSNHL